MTVELIHGDAVEVMAGMPECSVDAIVCDPPYDLVEPRSGGDGPGRGSGVLWTARSDEAKARRRGGFMGKSWDGTGVAFRPETWAEALRVLKPGGHLLAFGGTRTSHRLACAIEDAGFEIRDSIVWMHAQGFPKSLDIGKALDKMAGAEREVVGPKIMPDGRPMSAASHEGSGNRHEGYYRPWRDDAEAVKRNQSVTAPATDLARQWDGWGTALKPAHEPVVCARKPLNLVPFGEIIASTTLAVEALLWSIAPAKLADRLSASSPHAPIEASGSVRWLAVVWHMAPCDEASVQMGTFSSPAAASTFWSIVRSWSAILGALSSNPNTFTTETGTRLTTALTTLNSSILATIPESITQVATVHGGLWPNAETADASSSGGASSWSHIPTPSAHEHVSMRFIAHIAAELASIAAECSRHLLATDESSAQWSAPTDSTTPSEEKPRPAHEPIVVARKPLQGTVAETVMRWGTGGLNIDGCRIGIAKDVPASPSRTAGSVLSGSLDGSLRRETGDEGGHNPNVGRWPANVLLSHAPGCTPVGVRRVKGSHDGGNHLPNPSGPFRNSDRGQTMSLGYADPDGFEEIEAWECERDPDTGEYVCPIALLDEQAGERKSHGGGTSRGIGYGSGASAVRPIAVSDSGSNASRFFFVAKASRRERDLGLEGMPAVERHAYAGNMDGLSDPRMNNLQNRLPSRNHHPTIKPIQLMRHLVRLVTPPGGTVLDCFMGSGSTGCACVQEGFDFVGIDAEEEYVEIARARIAHWASEPQKLPRRPAVRNPPSQVKTRPGRGVQLALEIAD